MRKHVSSQAGTHKNISRLQFLKSLHPSVAEKLKWILEDCRNKEKGK